jgi:hypothetical protein
MTCKLDSKGQRYGGAEHDYLNRRATRIRRVPYCRNHGRMYMPQRPSEAFRISTGY